MSDITCLVRRFRGRIFSIYTFVTICFTVVMLGILWRRPTEGVVKNRKLLKTIAETVVVDKVPWNTPKEPLGDSYIYGERKEKMLSACSRLNTASYKGNNSELGVKNHLILDRKHRLIYCAMEKVGCTFWKRVFQISTGLRPEKNPFEIPQNAAHGGGLETCSRLHFDEILQLASSFKKFLFVREPYSRLFSVYVDKIFSPQPFFFFMRVNIAKFTRSPEEAAAAGCAPHVTFAEFTKYVINSLLTGKEMDGHFVPMYDHCRPCALAYDIIGKLENFSEDAVYVVKALNLSQVVEVNLNDQATDNDTILDMVKHVYGGRKNIMKCMPFQDAVKLLWKKCQIRGIIDKTVELPERFLTDENMTANDMLVTITDANIRMNPARKKTNRREALIEGVRLLSSEDIKMYRKLFFPDFELFGYPIAPDDMFNDKPQASNFSYLSF